MRETVAKLKALQAIDDEARGFLQERDGLREKIQRLKEILEHMQGELEDKRVKLAEATRWYQEKDAELKVDQDKIQRAKIKLQAVTKNKEYMAMQKEIESLRESSKRREEEIENLRTHMAEFEASISAEQQKIAELHDEVQSEEAQNATRIAELDELINSISAKKKDVTKGLKPALVSRYRRVHAARNGIAIVPVNNGACTGCNFSLPPQQLVRVQKGATLEVCRNCSRIMFWVDPEPEDEE